MLATTPTVQEKGEQSIRMACTEGSCMQEYLWNYPSSHKSLINFPWQLRKFIIDWEDAHTLRCQKGAQLSPEGQKYKERITSPLKSHLAMVKSLSVLRHSSLVRGQVTAQDQQLLTWLESHGPNKSLLTGRVGGINTTSTWKIHMYPTLKCSLYHSLGAGSGGHVLHPLPNLQSAAIQNSFFFPL